MDMRQVGKVVSVCLMGAGAVAAFALSAAVPGFEVAPAWRFAFGAFLAFNGVVIGYLPAPRPDRTYPRG